MALKTCMCTRALSLSLLCGLGPGIPLPAPSVGGNYKAYSFSRPFSSFPACLPATWKPLCLSCPFIPNAGQDERDDRENVKASKCCCLLAKGETSRARKVKLMQK